MEAVLVSQCYETSYGTQWKQYSWGAARSGSKTELRHVAVREAAELRGPCSALLAQTVNLQVAMVVELSDIEASWLSIDPGQHHDRSSLSGDAC